MKIFKNKIYKDKSAGFTLMEIIVTVMIFSVMAVVIVSIFVRAVSLERRIISAQRVQENATFLIESMAKEIRVADIVNQDSPACAATTLSVSHPIYGTIIYSLDASGNIQRQVPPVTQIVSSSDVQFTRMNFCITGSNPTDGLTPRVTIILSLKNRTGSINTNADLQTTVFSRNIISELQN